MENRLKQRSCRGSYSEPQSRKHEGSSSGRDDKGWKWFQGPILEDYDEEEHATAVAAAAFAIHSLAEAKLPNVNKLKESPKSSGTTMRRKEDSISRRPSYGGETSMKKSSGQNSRTAESDFPVRCTSSVRSPRPISPAVGYQKQRGSPIQHNNVKTRADAWEKAKMEKIQNWYEKIKSKILSWERENKLQAKLEMERKGSLEHRRATELQHYQNKIARIDMIAQAAGTQLEDKRRKEESEAREKANRMRKTGRVPIKYCCFIF